MEFLNNEGLEKLIENIQSGVIKTKLYENVIAESYDSTNGSVFYIELSNLSSSNIWGVSYKVFSEFSEQHSSNQASKVTFMGIGDKILYHSINNLIYDTAKLSAINHIIIEDKINKKVFFGLDISNSYNTPHDIRIEICGVSNCDILLYKTPKGVNTILTGNELSNCVFNEYEFKQNTNSSCKIDNLHKVAFSGSYNDLKDLPDLLNVVAGEDEDIIFYKGELINNG